MVKNRRNGIKHGLAAVLFCMVLGMGILCLADEQGTVLVESAKIRASADAASSQLGSVSKGGTVDIIGETTGADGKAWYHIYVDGSTKGYIRADLIEKKGGSGTTTAAADQTPTTASPVDARKGTVKTSNVRIRKGASTNHDVVATANRGMVVTVTGEADGSDGKKWYQISFTYDNKEITGFIRSDFVTFDEVPADAEVSEITGENAGTEAEEPQTQEPQQDEGQQPDQSDGSKDVIPMNVEEVPYILPGFEPVDMTSNGEKINTYKNGKFYLFYAQKQNGEEGWYLFDSEKGIYQRYPYTTEDAVVPDETGGSVGIIPVIVLVVIIVILVATVGLLLMKLKGGISFGDGFDDEYPEDDEDDLEEIEVEDDEDEIRARQPQPARMANGQPARRPQSGGMQQPVRRPQNGAQQPARYPQNAGMGQPQGRRPQPPQNGGQANGQPARRPQPQNGENAGAARQPAGRPQGSRPVSGQGGQNRRPSPNGQPPARRPQPQNDKQPQRGYKAKNLLENEDEDVDFMDL